MFLRCSERSEWAKGIEQGRQRVNHLYAALIKDNRTAELFQATQDPELQEKLMEEYGIK